MSEPINLDVQIRQGSSGPIATTVEIYFADALNRLANNEVKFGSKPYFTILSENIYSKKYFECILYPQQFTFNTDEMLCKLFHDRSWVLFQSEFRKHALST